MIRLRNLVLLAALAIAAACSSPLSCADRDADWSQPRLDAAADSAAARGGGNLMGGN